MKMLALLGIFIFSFTAAAMNGKTTYQAKIIKPDGYPLEASSVNFRFTVMDTTGSCALYVEDYAAVNMSGSGGLISFALGSGTRSFPTSGTSMTFRKVFENVGSFPCRAPNLTVGSYGPGIDDARKIVMQFQDSSGWQTLPAMAINAVPYAMFAHKANSALDAGQLNGKTDAAFVENATLAALNCTATQAIKFNNATFSCIDVPASGSGGITSVTTSGSVLSTGGTASAPVISIQAATISQDGYLTSLDYAEFKAKLSASSTQIVNTLGYTPVSSSTVASQIASSTLAGDVSGNPGSNTVDSVGGKTSSQISTSVNDTLAATSSATADTLVKRNSSGNVTINDLYANAAKINYVDIYKPSTSFNIRLQAPTSLATNYVLNLPTASGTTGQVLSTDGSGNLSWISPTTGSVVSVSATAPLASSGGSNPTISITQATSSTDGYLSSTDFNTFNNKQQATSAAIIATLGYTPADDAASGTYAQKVNNLSDLTNIPQARTNLGLGTLAVGNSIDLGSASATGIIADARLANQSNVTSGTQYTKVTVDGKGRVTSGASLSSSDVTNALGYTPADNAASGTYAQRASNLSDLTNIATARTNLGLGTFATASTIDLGSASATGILDIARLPSFSGDVSSVSGSNLVTLNAIGAGVTSGTQYTKVTVDGKGRVTSGSQLSSSDVTTALGYTPATSTTLAASFVQKTGDTMTGVLNLPSNGLVVGGNQLIVSGTHVGIGTTSLTATLDISGTIKISGANPGSGKVLTSDANGLASWQTLNALSQSTFNSYVSSANCGVSQTMYWNSVGSSFACAAVAGLNATTISAGTIDALRLPAASSSADGIVTQSAQSFSGIKTFINNVIVNAALNVAGALSATSASITGAVIAGSFSTAGGLTASGAITTTNAVTADRIKVANSSATCDATTEGSLRYNTTSKKMEFCNGVIWGNVSQGTVATVTLSAPSPARVASSGVISYTVTYGGGTDTPTINLVAGHISFTGSTSGCAVQSISGSGLTRTVNISGCTVSTGNMALNIASSTAQSTTGDAALAAIASNVAIDNAGPTAPTVTLGATPSNYTNTPTITYTAASDVGGGSVASYQARVVRNSDSLVVLDWTMHTNTEDIGGLSLVANTQYNIYIRALDDFGNIGTTSSIKSFMTIANLVDCDGPGPFNSGDICNGKNGVVILGSLSPGALSGSGTDQYMTTPSGCGEIPPAQKVGSGSSAYPNADFTPTCSGNDSLVKTWNNGTTNYYDIPALVNYTDTFGPGGPSKNDQNYGSSNTAAIVSIQPTDTASGGAHAAAMYCDKLVYGGYSDWYLPNRYEAYLFYTNKAYILGLQNGEYWTSTERGNSQVWRLNMGNGNLYDYNYSVTKNSTNVFRCVRRF